MGPLPSICYSVLFVRTGVPGTARTGVPGTVRTGVPGTVRTVSGAAETSLEEALM